jgi:hypothetical protein
MNHYALSALLSVVVICLTVLVALRVIPWESIPTAVGAIFLWLSRSPLAPTLENDLIETLSKLLSTSPPPAPVVVGVVPSSSVVSAAPTPEVKP